MQLHDIKQIPIVDYLAQTGYKPKLIKGVNYWYCSPLRTELTPSFKVNAERNQWYDFGTGDHGDIIDLVCALQHCSTAEAMRSLSRLKETLSAESFSFGGIIPVRSQAPSMELISVQAVMHPKLLLYLSERGLQRSDVSPFLSEVYYRVSEKCFFALGFPNDAGGWELRNPYFKGCFAPKAITTIKGTDSHKLQLFEGFMDFLSWRKLHPEGQADSIMLNSLTLLPKLIPSLHPYAIIETFLDNDEAGDQATKQLIDAGLPVKDIRACYAPYKDINEYLILAEQRKQILTPRKRGLRR
ncbi:toprim domain-containing protein [Porphyromonas sp. oral taxon 275]|uniref:toprim domain-containing protein n=1 Tax=Porphyromonas sp. oral taxon 275 TaxID=712435 RepID=UPI001BA66592|nr:toprim domain-containing protein [Porphyromonas sp. oral taxon 275]QUB42982.1 toprim domain-containing protein [Porphyromonas sp. oral taxon 275]